MYKTKDFTLACVMYAEGFKLIDTEKEDGCRTIFFVFNTVDKEELKIKIINDFVNQSCYVNVKKFTWATKKLRQEMDKYKQSKTMEVF